MAGAGEIQHILKIANLKNCFFWRSHQVKVCQDIFFLIWHGAHRCLVNAVLAPLKHTQHRHIFWTFPLIHKTHKTPIEIINSIEIPLKKTICKTHQTSVGVAPNALEPLNYLASPCRNGFFYQDLHPRCKKNVTPTLGGSDNFGFFKNRSHHFWWHR